MIRFFFVIAIICFIFQGFQAGMVALGGTAIMWGIYTEFAGDDCC